MEDHITLLYIMKNRMLILMFRFVAYIYILNNR